MTSPLESTNPTLVKEIRVLFVEDSQLDAQLVRRFLSQNFRVVEFSQVDSSEALRRELDRVPWDLVLSDYQVPGFRVEEALAFVRAKNENLPFILVTGTIGEEKTVEILKFGADDIVLKDNLGRLRFAIDRVLREAQVRKSEQEARMLAEKAVRAREQMLAVVSHDLRNPLGAIQLNAETIRQKLNGAEKQDSAQLVAHIESIIRSSMRLKSLISDVLDKVRIEAGTFVVSKSKGSLNEFLEGIREIFEPLAREKRQTFQIEKLPSDFLVELDFERVAQILSNLIGNAMKFTPADGQIRLEVSPLDQQIEIRVRDSGPGIASQDLDKIFQKYWQDSESPRQGIGLGLSIVKDLVRAHEGRIWVESAKGVGTCFGFILPTQLTPLVTSQSRTKASTNRWICLLDDDDDLREILVENLRSLGYQVTSFSTGHEALEKLSNSQERPDLLILDYRLPDMKGPELLEKLPEIYLESQVPVIFLSAESSFAIPALRHDRRAFVPKPLRIRELEKTIESFF